MMSTFQKIKKWVMQESRAKKLDHFYSLCDTNSSILDVGVSNNEHNNSVNFLLKNFKLNPNQYTGLAVQAMGTMREKYPDKKFVEYSGGMFPFARNEFDWVFSNAVIEHVGSRHDQLSFLDEMLRVGKNLFFTTPNKGFPIESHTNVFFRHWFDNSFYKWCKKNSPFYSIENLRLFGIKDLYKIMEDSKAENYRIKKNKIFWYPMTFTVVCSTTNR